MAEDKTKTATQEAAEKPADAVTVDVSVIAKEAADKAVKDAEAQIAEKLAAADAQITEKLAAADAQIAEKLAAAEKTLKGKADEAVPFSKVKGGEAPKGGVLAKDGDLVKCAVGEFMVDSVTMTTYESGKWTEAVPSAWLDAQVKAGKMIVK